MHPHHHRPSADMSTAVCALGPACGSGQSTPSRPRWGLRVGRGGGEHTASTLAGPSEQCALEEEKGEKERDGAREGMPVRWPQWCRPRQAMLSILSERGRGDSSASVSLVCRRHHHHHYHHVEACSLHHIPVRRRVHTRGSIATQRAGRKHLTRQTLAGYLLVGALFCVFSLARDWSRRRSTGGILPSFLRPSSPPAALRFIRSEPRRTIPAAKPRSFSPEARLGLARRLSSDTTPKATGRGCQGILRICATGWGRRGIAK